MDANTLLKSNAICAFMEHVARHKDIPLFEQFKLWNRENPLYSLDTYGDYLTVHGYTKLHIVFQTDRTLAPQILNPLTIERKGYLWVMKYERTATVLALVRLNKVRWFAYGKEVRILTTLPANTYSYAIAHFFRRLAHRPDCFAYYACPQTHEKCRKHLDGFTGMAWELALTLEHDDKIWDLAQFWGILQYMRGGMSYHKRKYSVYFPYMDLIEEMFYAYKEDGN